MIQRLCQPKLTSQVRRSFTTYWGPAWERPVIDRVVSTATWPVPYYQRIFKAYPVRDNAKYSLLLSDLPVDDSNWYSAKDLLKTTVKGRQILEYVENHLQTDDYLIIQNDVAKMAKAYVNDLVLFLDVANKENKRILDKCNLI